MRLDNCQARRYGLAKWVGDDLSEQPKAGLHQELLVTYLAKRENLRRFLAVRLGSRAQAEDAVQDLFLKLAAVEPSAVFDNPEAMIYRMAANHAVDELRRRRRSETRDRAWGEMMIGPGGQAMAEHASAEQAWAARQRLAALMTALERLPPRMRQAFRLCKLEDCTREEAARQMGVSVKAVEKQITAALKALTWPRS